MFARKDVAGSIGLRTGLSWVGVSVRLGIII
jgi:hypothetical protein